MQVWLKRFRKLFVIAVALLGALPPASGVDAKHKTICQLCGMDAAKSETEFILYRKTSPELRACCVNCARRLMKKLGAEVTEITALDYRARKHVAAPDAFYVRGSKRIPKGSMAPYVFAFGSRKDAEEFRARYGGEALTFNEILEQLEAKGKSE
jgi:nitrous oxide reductase accessory protein NosL